MQPHLLAADDAAQEGGGSCGGVGVRGTVVGGEQHTTVKAGCCWVQRAQGSKVVGSLSVATLDANQPRCHAVCQPEAASPSPLVPTALSPLHLIWHPCGHCCRRRPQFEGEDDNDEPVNCEDTWLA